MGPHLRPAQMDPSKAPGIGFTIVGVRVMGNKKTARGMVLLHARVPLGNPFTLEVRDRIRRNLLASPFCKSVIINWEVHKTKPRSVVLFLTITERITWIISPAFSYSDGNYGGSVLFKEKNLLGSGKLLRVFAGYNNEAQRFTMQYKDPNILFSPVMWSIELDYQRFNLKEYDPTAEGIRKGTLLRSQTFQQFMTGLALGYFWFNWVRTSIKYQFGLVDFAIPRCLRSNPASKFSLQRCPAGSLELPVSDIGRSYYVGPMALLQDNGIWTDSIDERGKFWRWKRDARIQLKAAIARSQTIYGMMRGFDVMWTMDIASTNLGGELDYVTWALTYRHGFNFGGSREMGARHNLTIFAEQAATHNAPYFRELRTGGTALRGYISQQLAGDTMTRLRVQYKVHMFTLGWFMFRAVAVYDSAWIFYRDGGQEVTRLHERNGLRRYFLPHATGPRDRTLWNNGIGAGLRIYIRPLSMGSVGLDVAYGIEARTVRFIVMIGT